MSQTLPPNIFQTYIPPHPETSEKHARQTEKSKSRFETVFDCSGKKITPQVVLRNLGEKRAAVRMMLEADADMLWFQYSDLCFNNICGGLCLAISNYTLALMYFGTDIGPIDFRIWIYTYSLKMITICWVPGPGLNSFIQTKLFRKVVPSSFLILIRFGFNWFGGLGIRTHLHEPLCKDRKLHQVFFFPKDDQYTDHHFPHDPEACYTKDSSGWHRVFQGLGGVPPQNFWVGKSSEILTGRPTSLSTVGCTSLDRDSTK